MYASVVVPTYERPQKLEQTLTSLCNQSAKDYEIIVVDDGSDSDEQETILNQFADREWVSVMTQENAGPAAARNNGWRQAKGDFVLFTDDDCLVPTDWVESLTSAFEEGVAGVGGPLIPCEERLRSNQFARAHEFRDRMNYDWPDEPVTGHGDLNVGGTANVAYRRDVLSEVGGFDESFPLAAGEDADLQKRVLDKGYRMKFIPVPVRHNDEYEWQSFVQRAIRSGKGTNHYLRKHDRSRSPIRVLLGLVGSLLYLIPALRRSHEPAIALLYVVERMLNRWGELQSLIEE